MLQKKKQCIKSRGVKTFEQNEDVYIFLFCLNIIFFYLVLPEAEEDVSQKTKYDTFTLIFKFKKFSHPGS